MTVVGCGHRTEKRGDAIDLTDPPWLASAKGDFLCLGAFMPKCFYVSDAVMSNPSLHGLGIGFVLLTSSQLKPLLGVRLP